MSDLLPIKILTYNIHKGYAFGSRRYTLVEARQVLREGQSDLVFLQEVMGEHKHGSIANQVEFLAEGYWPYISYGGNSQHSKGNHGNAILSKFPLSDERNHDLTLHRFEKRGLLYVKADIGLATPLHLYCTHLNLREKDRLLQAQQIIHQINSKHGPQDPLILCGDFNDWRNKLTTLFAQHQLFEAHGAEIPKTFPSFLPTLAIDRIFVKNLTVDQLHPMIGPSRSPSDHLPLSLSCKLTA